MKKFYFWVKHNVFIKNENLILKILIFATYGLMTILNKFSKASVTILAGFSPEFDPPFLWRSKHQTKNDYVYQ